MILDIIFADINRSIFADINGKQHKIWREISKGIYPVTVFPLKNRLKTNF